MYFHCLRLLALEASEIRGESNYRALYLDELNCIHFIFIKSFMSGLLSVLEAYKKLPHITHSQSYNKLPRLQSIFGAAITCDLRNECALVADIRQ